MKTQSPLTILALCTLGLVGCLSYAQPTDSFTLSSAAFADGELMGPQFTCDGAGVSPPIAWKNAPATTKSFAVTMHHFPPANESKHVYMVVYNLPASSDHLEQGSTLGTWGVNTVNRQTAYTPPCSKGPGRKDYILTVYALSTAAVSSGSATMDDLLSNTKGTTLATAMLSVGYARP